MHVNAKRIAFLGLLLAFDILLIILGNVIEMNTLFFLAGASFCVGIAVRECGLRLGFGFYLGSILLGLILAPNKFYIITYGAMGCYIFLREFVWEKTVVRSGNFLDNLDFNNQEYNNKKNQNSFQPTKQKRLLWILKFIVFNILYIPLLLLFPKLFYAGELSPVIYAGLFVGGQVGMLIYDYAYNYFQVFVWGKMRKALRINL